MSALEAANEIVDGIWVCNHASRDTVTELAKIIDRLAVQPAVAAEQTRWQDAIYEKCKKAVGSDRDHLVDGGGCDSGDPLDFTLAEVGQALALIDGDAEDWRTIVAAERKRAEGLVAVIRAGIPKVQFAFDVSHSSTICYELRHLKLTLERALADYESNAPVPTEETGVRELVAKFSDLAVDMEKHANDHLHGDDPEFRLQGAVEGVCADRIKALLSKYKGV